MLKISTQERPKRSTNEVVAPKEEEEEYLFSELRKCTLFFCHRKTNWPVINSQLIPYVGEENENSFHI